jgi:16S rRNA processing protein RimM
LHGSFGVKGWIHVQPLSGNKQSLIHSKQWWLQTPAPAMPATDSARAPAQPALTSVLDCKDHGESLVVQFAGVINPEQAQALRHVEVLLPRSSFAKPGINEYYWVDLIGCQVVNLQNQVLGVVTQMDDHGAHAIMVVQSADREQPHLIPFVAVYVGEVSLEARKISVDWQDDY